MKDLIMNSERHALATSLHSSVVLEPKTMLRITTESKRGKLFLSVEGCLSGPRVATLEQCWRELYATNPRPKFCVNLCGVSFIDNAGKVLLKEMHRLGAELVAEGCLNQAIVNEITAAKNGAPSRDAKDDDPSKGAPIIFYIILFGLLLAPGFASAQTSSSALPANAPTDVLKLTLQQSVALAIKQNPTQQIAVLNAAESIQDKNITRADLLPQANLRVADSANRVNLHAQFGGNLPPGFPFPEHLGPYQVFSAGPAFGTNVFDFSLWKRYRAALSNVDASKANSLSVREQVILLVVSQYIGTLRAVANVEASRSRVELAQALYDQAADLQKEGVGTGIDTLRANVELQNEKQRLIEAENDRDASLFGLSKLLNLDPRQKIELADSLAFFDTQQPDVEASIDGALSTRQEWKARKNRPNSTSRPLSTSGCPRSASTATGPTSAPQSTTAFPPINTPPRSICRSSPAAAFMPKSSRPTSNSRSSSSKNLTCATRSLSMLKPLSSISIPPAVKCRSPISASRSPSRRSTRPVTAFRPASPTTLKSSLPRTRFPAPTTIRSRHFTDSIRPVPTSRAPSGRWKRLTRSEDPWVLRSKSDLKTRVS